jgi:C-terminal processing protease CtpA/Prc
MRRVAVAVLAAMMFVNAPPGFAQSSDEFAALRKEIEALKAGQDAVLKELQEIRSLLRARPGPQAAAEPRDIVLSIDGVPVKGNSRAKLVLIDFSDYQ